MLKIIAFDKSYQPEVVKLICEILASEFGLVDAIERPDLQDIAAFYQKDQGNFWLALEEEIIIGTIALADYGDGRGYLKRMYVRPAYRRQGVAQHLLATALAFAQEKNYQTTFLGTLDTMMAANAFYQKNGFRKIPALPKDFPEFGDNVFYKRDLRVEESM